MGNYKGIDTARRVSSIVWAALMLMLAAWLFYLAATRAEAGATRVVGGGLLAGLSYAVYRRRRWALGLSALVAVLTAVLLPIGFINPFRTGDQLAAGGQPTPIWQTLLWIVPLDALLLGFASMLDPRRQPSKYDNTPS